MSEISLPEAVQDCSLGCSVHVAPVYGRDLDFTGRVSANNDIHELIDAFSRPRGRARPGLVSDFRAECQNPCSGSEFPECLPPNRKSDERNVYCCGKAPCGCLPVVSETQNPRTSHSQPPRHLIPVKLWQGIMAIANYETNRGHLRSGPTWCFRHSMDSSF